MLLKKLLAIGLLTAGLLEGGMDAAMPDKDIDGTLYLANRSQILASEYVPETEVLGVAGQRQSMRPDAAAAIRTMFEAAKGDKVTLLSVSGYRSYSKQKLIYSRKVKSSGKAKANTLVALPGASEHQLGLALDVGQKSYTNLNAGFGKTPGGQWLVKHAHEYGFIIRYQEGQEEITGYAYEPWHVRFLGPLHAAAIFDAGVPLETYLSSYRLGVAQYLLSILEVHP